MKALVNPTNTAECAHSLEMGSDPLSDIASRCSVKSARRERHLSVPMRV
jgi:hypothetical protein